MYSLSWYSKSCCRYTCRHCIVCSYYPAFFNWFSTVKGGISAYIWLYKRISLRFYEYLFFICPSYDKLKDTLSVGVVLHWWGRMTIFGPCEVIFAVWNSTSGHPMGAKFILFCGNHKNITGKWKMGRGLILSNGYFKLTEKLVKSLRFFLIVVCVLFLFPITVYTHCRFFLGFNIQL